MGFYGTNGASRADIIHQIIHERQNSKVIAKASKANILWTVEEHLTTGERMIVCYLLRKERDGYSYKPMDEAMGPCYYTCPLSFLDLAPLDPTPENKYALNWREEVKKYHAQQAQASKIAVGTVVNLIGTRTPITVRIGRTGRSMMGQDINTGKMYRIPKSMIGEIVTEVN